MDKMKNLVVGLTGQTGAGKTTVSDYLKENGVTIIDADHIAREVVESDYFGLHEDNSNPVLFGEHIFGLNVYELDKLLEEDGKYKTQIPEGQLPRRIISCGQKRILMNNMKPEAGDPSIFGQIQPLLRMCPGMEIKGINFV